MAAPRAIDMALDLARMPAVAPSMSASPLPADIFEVIRIAAESPEACRAAALATGENEPVLIDAARFYLQQVLFREEADCYRVLGLRPEDSRASARDHMRWLLKWLHPDRNGSWDAVYAKRIVDAWREVSGDSRPLAEVSQSSSGRYPVPFRIPWIARPAEKRGSIAQAAIKVTACLIVMGVLLGLTAPASTLRLFSDLW